MNNKLRRLLLLIILPTIFLIVFVLGMFLDKRVADEAKHKYFCGPHTDVTLYYDVKDERIGLIRFPSKNCSFLPVLYCSGRQYDLEYGCVEISGKALEKVKKLLNR